MSPDEYEARARIIRERKDLVGALLSMIAFAFFACAIIGLSVFLDAVYLNSLLDFIGR